MVNEIYRCWSVFVFLFVPSLSCIIVADSVDGAPNTGLSGVRAPSVQGEPQTPQLQRGVCLGVTTANPNVSSFLKQLSHIELVAS